MEKLLFLKCKSSFCYSYQQKFCICYMCIQPQINKSWHCICPKKESMGNSVLYLEVRDCIYSEAVTPI